MIEVGRVKISNVLICLLGLNNIENSRMVDMIPGGVNISKFPKLCIHLGQGGSKFPKNVLKFWRGVHAASKSQLYRSQTF